MRPARAARLRFQLRDRQPPFPRPVGRGPIFERKDGDAGEQQPHTFTARVRQPPSEKTARKGTKAKPLAAGTRWRLCYLCRLTGTNTSGASGASNDDGRGNRRRNDGERGNTRNDDGSRDDDNSHTPKLRLEPRCRLRLRRQLLASRQL